MKAKYTIQCTSPVTGKIGNWLFTGESHKIKGSELSPVFPDLTDLFQWMQENGWKTAGGMTAEKIES